MADVVIRPARPDEHEQISALALRSKGHWGYSAEFLEACRAELTYDVEQCGSGRMWVAEAGVEVLGFALLEGNPPTGELAALFVDPSAIGTGTGGLLLRHVLRAATESGFTRLELDADPGAVPFYEHFGAVALGSTPSGSIPGRMLPHLEFRLGFPDDDAMPESPFADEGIAAFVGRASLGRLDVTELRAGVAARSAGRARGPNLARVVDVTAADRPARLYRPDLAASGPLLLWLHGGGWTIGDIPSFDRVSRRLAAASGVSVLTLDYRLAPEHPWPAAVDDAVEALAWIASAPVGLGFTPSAIGVGGDSAGGNLAALVTLRLARELPAIRPDLLALCYANTDLAGDYPSRTEKGSGFGLDVADSEFFNRQWVPDRTRWSAPGVSPLQSRDLGLLPPTVVVTVEHDHLRDEGCAFADRLEAEQVPVTRRCETGLVHNFLMLDELSPSAAAAADRFAADVGDGLRRLDAG